MIHFNVKTVDTGTQPIPNQQRTLGLGFGPGREVSIYGSDLYSLFPYDMKTPVPQEEISTQLNRVIPHVLNNIGVLRLRKIFKDSIPTLSDEIKEKILHSEPLFSSVDSTMIARLGESIPENRRPQNTREWAEWFRKDLEEKDYHLLSYLIPNFLKEMGDEERKTFVNKIFPFLKDKDLFILTDATYLNKTFAPSGDYTVNLKWISNGRTLILKPTLPTPDSPPVFFFRGRGYRLDHAHIHLQMQLPNGETPEREFMMYDSREHEALVRGTDVDPNMQTLVEWHTVFAYTKGTVTRELLVVATIIRIGNNNPLIEEFLENTNSMRELNPNMEDFIPLNKPFSYKKLLLGETGLDKLNYFSFGSLNQLVPRPLQNGIIVLMKPDPVEMSPQNYKDLEGFFGTIQSLPEEKFINPIDREGNKRTSRDLFERV